jgi:hypothetical protein
VNSVDVRLRRRPEGWVGEVEVEQDGLRTQHTVSVSPADAERWGRGDTDGDIEELVRRSFDFLLDREPATSILRSFELSVIQRSFQEYDRVIRR